MPAPRIRPIILAGSRNEGPLRQVASQDLEALIPVGGRPMVAHVIDATLSARSLLDPVLVGFPEFAEVPQLRDQHTVPAGETFVESIKRGSNAAGDVEYLLFITGDVPLVSGEILDRFIEAALAHEADFFVPVVRRTLSEDRYPDVARTYARLREGELTLGNCFLGTRDCIFSMLPTLDRLFAMRKSVIRMGWIIGPTFLLKLAFGRAGISDAEALFRRITGFPGRAIFSDDPEIALDVDKPSHLRAVEDLMAR